VALLAVPWVAGYLCQDEAKNKEGIPGGACSWIQERRLTGFFPVSQRAELYVIMTSARRCGRCRFQLQLARTLSAPALAWILSDRTSEALLPLYATAHRRNERTRNF
jgi:hypothetical protein